MLTQDFDHVNQPPYTNRGVELSHLQKSVFSIDWLRLTIWTHFQGVAPLLAILGLDEGLEELGHGGIGFRCVMAGAHGFQLYRDPVNENQVFVSLNLPSKCLQVVGMDRVSAAAQWLCEQGQKGLRWDATRLDLAFDTQSFTVPEFVAAWEGGAVETNVRRTSEIKSSDGGHTFYVGSRQSTALARIYHKMDGSSFGDDSFTRVELELKKERANLAFLQVVAAPMQDWAVMAAGLLSGFMTVKSSWWAELIDGAARSWLKLRQNIPTIARAEKWLNKQVLPSLALVVGALSSGDVEDMNRLLINMVNEGRKRFTKQHENMLKNYSGDTSPQFAIYSI